jgi:hypothetical protein
VTKRPAPTTVRAAILGKSQQLFGIKFTASETTYQQQGQPDKESHHDETPVTQEITSGNGKSSCRSSE